MPYVWRVISSKRRLQPFYVAGDIFDSRLRIGTKNLKGDIGFSTAATRYETDRVDVWRSHHERKSGIETKLHDQNHTSN